MSATDAEFADLIYCLVRSGPDDARYQNLSLVLVDPRGPGISISPIEHMNLRYTLSSDVVFDDAPVPLENVVGGPDALGRGWKMLAGRALGPAGQIVGLLMQYQGARTAMESLNKIMDKPVERPAGESFIQRPLLRGDIEFRNVKLAYPGR